MRSEEVKLIVNNWVTGLLSIDDAMEQLGVKKSTFYSLVQELKDI